MAEDYVTAAGVKAYLGITENTRDAVLGQCATAASRWIDNYTSRRFWADDTATARNIRPRARVLRDGTDYLLLVPDIADALTLDAGRTAVAQYWGEPGETAITGLYSGSTWGESPVVITAKWGWPTVPDAIVQAATILAARLFRRKDSPEGVLGNAEWGLVRVSRVDPDVLALVDPYVLPGIA